MKEIGYCASIGEDEERGEEDEGGQREWPIEGFLGGVI